MTAANYAPNQNKNRCVHVIDDQALIQLIEDCARRFVKKMYAILCKFPLTGLLVKLFHHGGETIKRKIEYDGFRRVACEHVQTIILVSGKSKVPVTECSAHYRLVTMMLMAEALELPYRKKT